MNRQDLNNIHMIKEVLKQYRDLNLNSNKIFYYSYARLDIKLQALIAQEGLSPKYLTENGDIDAIMEKSDLTVAISIDEIKKLTGRDRIERRDLNRIADNLSKNAWISLENDDKKEVVFLYSKIFINFTDKRIEITFNKHGIELFEMIRNNPYVNIDFNEIMNLETKYQMNLYLYALTVLRGNKGNIQISIDNMKDILSGETSKINDYNFIRRFLTVPSEEINSNNNLNINIYATKNKNNINLLVEKKKKEEEKKSSVKRKEEEPF